MLVLDNLRRGRIILFIGRGDLDKLYDFWLLGNQSCEGMFSIEVDAPYASKDDIAGRVCELRDEC